MDPVSFTPLPLHPVTWRWTLLPDALLRVPHFSGTGCLCSRAFLLSEQGPLFFLFLFVSFHFITATHMSYFCVSSLWMGHFLCKNRTFHMFHTKRNSVWTCAVFHLLGVYHFYLFFFFFEIYIFMRAEGILQQLGNLPCKCWPRFDPWRPVWSFSSDPSTQS